MCSCKSELSELHCWALVWSKAVHLTAGFDKTWAWGQLGEGQEPAPSPRGAELSSEALITGVTRNSLGMLVAWQLSDAGKPRLGRAWRSICGAISGWRQADDLPEHVTTRYNPDGGLLLPAASEHRDRTSEIAADVKGLKRDITELGLQNDYVEHTHDAQEEEMDQHRTEILALQDSN
ncbi:hypothetical protein NDU88_004604 [Pleurodeles waltl]|uniref:Uncharacterized protein n=1 Tax=Pleurodeles waltl TaxID=8319 RepID=A0AAV7SJ94_PLEWA|nr:hypothetical protein NDU88_004604 [Pleurodeles waltl]